MHLAINKRNLLNFSFILFDYRIEAMLNVNLYSLFFLNCYIINRTFFLNKKKKSKLYFLEKNSRFKSFYFNNFFEVIKKDRKCLILYFNVQKKLRTFRL